MRSAWLLILFGSLITYHCFTTVSGEESQPSYSQCKPYVDAALKGETPPPLPTTTSSSSSTSSGDSSSASPEDDSDEEKDAGGAQSDQPEVATTTTESDDGKDDDSSEEQQENNTTAPAEDAKNENDDNDDSKEAGEAGVEADDDSKEDTKADDDNDSKEGGESEKTDDDSDESKEETNADNTPAGNDDDDDSKEEESAATAEPAATAEDSDDSKAEDNDDDDDSTEAQPEGNATATDDGPDGDSGEDSQEKTERDGSDRDNVADKADQPDSDESQEEQEAQEAQATAQTAKPTESEAAVKSSATQTGNDDDNDSKEDSAEEKKDDDNDSKENADDDDSKENDDDDSGEDEANSYIPRSRTHLEQILALTDSEQAKGLSILLDKATQTTLKELKQVYETAIKPLEALYKYRDLSNRHFGDPEIFSKPMVVFMGPWSGGKSTILNWLLGIENQDAAIRTGADPSPAQFNIMTHGSEDEVLDGTQLAADWTFSGLQKFGQAFLDRLRGRKLPNRLLEKVNLVEIPGILEVRKQVERSFPFNDACQWFIDRADVLFLVYDPAKLDIGPETEAILDQLKGRENQVRIVLNKADTVKPDELLRLQATLIWNISPLMASAEPPTLYVASLWGKPLNPDSPTSLLIAHENHFLKDIRDATEKRVETRIAAARRFAVRVRNHAKMVDCYLNTYNNHRSFFSNKKKISDDIIEHPQNYHIYEGLSTLTNISRYDLPDPDTYRDFFRLNPLWEFPTLASTCTYFRGCPINKLDIAIAYDLPELLGRFRRQRESILSAQNQGQQQQQQQKGSKK